MNLHVNLNNAVDMIIDSKFEKQEELLQEKFKQLEQQLLNTASNPHHEILQQKEVFELLGIGRKRLKNWVGRGLKEMRVDNRVYYYYSDLLNFIEEGK